MKHFYKGVARDAEKDKLDAYAISQYHGERLHTENERASEREREKKIAEAPPVLQALLWRHYPADVAQGKNGGAL